MVVSKKRSAPRSLTTRLLVLGDKQVGKSASIVRYTTGRYIEEYGQATNDWLYRHSLGYNPKQNSTTNVELLEQKDIYFSNSSNFFASSTSLNSNNNNNNSNKNNNNNNNNYKNNDSINRSKNCNSFKDSNISKFNDHHRNENQQQQSLATRVALDQQIDNEMHDKQQMLNKLHWANAYIVIYAINDISTFNKAIKYLNLIANNINSPLDHHQTSRNLTSAFNHNTANSNSCSNISSSNTNNNFISNQGGSNGLFNRLSTSSSSSTMNHHQANSKSSPVNNHLNGCSCANNNNNNLPTYSANNNPRRPILLLANKKDLEKSGARQVSSNDGRMLAIRHQAMFAEVSIAESNKIIETTIDSFIDQIDSNGLHVDHLSAKQQQQLLVDLENQPKIVQWCPTIGLMLSQTNALAAGSPVWATLVKSQAVGSNLVQSNRIASTRLETDVRLIKPIGSVAKSVDTKISLKPLRATCRTLKEQSSSLSDQFDGPSKIKSLTNSTNKTTHIIPHQKPINSNRYENFKSSFRRASMAIVSGKQLAKSLTKTSNKQSERELDDKKNGEVFQSARSSFDSVSEPLVEQTNRKISTNSAPGPSNWIRTHIRLTRQENQKPVITSSSDPRLNSNELVAATDRIRKPLFKYKNRTQTGIFERIVDEDSYINLEADKKKSDQTSDQYKRSDTETSSENRANSSGSCGYNSTRCSSGRSSSSLSNGDTSLGSLFFLCNSERVNTSSSSSTHSDKNQKAKQIDRCNSRSTLSRASTSGGSCEETSGDEMLTDSNTTINSRVFHKANSQRVGSFKRALPPLAASVINVDNNDSTKKRHQLVKSVQGTLTNLTRSSNVMAKKSFCSALFKHSIIDATAPVMIASTPAIKLK